jgi:alpha-L-rhamnosidase
MHAAQHPAPVNPVLLRKTWPSRWISHQETVRTELSVYHFRKEFNLSSVPDSLWIHVSADSRYRLYVNGKWLSHGPAAGDLRHWQFETLDIAPFLKPGKNYITAEVWNSEGKRAMAHLSYETGFILQENDLKKHYGLNTDSTWLSCRNEGYTAIEQWSSNTDIGPAEMVDFSRYPSDWNADQLLDRSQWKAAKEGSHGQTKWSVFNQPGRFLVQRSIPAMRMQPIRFASVRKSSGLLVKENSLRQKRSYHIPANTKVEWLIDQKELTNAYPVLLLDKGKNAAVNIAYAEALYDNANRKGQRDQIEGRHFRGFQDGIIASGAQTSYTPLWYRTFRYLKLSVVTKGEALDITDFYAIKSEYPFDLNASFKSDDRTLDTILNIGWRTAKLCAMETYMDCPYYERLQYIGDTRIQGMVSLYNSGDDRLLRQALNQFDQSRMSEGITLSRYPTNYDQQIPPFSLWWIGMVHDYYMYRGDEQLIQSLLPGVRQVISFFETYQQADGSLGEMPYWNFTDWPNSKGWIFGVPPNAQSGNSAILDMQLLLAYQTAAKLEAALGSQELNDSYQQKIMQLKNTITIKYWSEQKKLFADEDTRQLFSQHANVLAVLTELIPQKQSADIMDRVLSDTSLAQTTIYFRYYQMLALKKVGYANRYLDQLDVWRDHMKHGLTTWAEISNTETTRSDCHAWGASPNIELYRIVLGIDTDGPGFTKVKIEPALGKLKNASGTIPHPKGPLSVSYREKGKKWLIEIQLPISVSGNLIWKGKSYPLSGNKKNSFIL